MKGNLKKNKIANFLTYIALIITVFFVNLPNISMLGTALKTKSEALTSISLMPKVPHFENFAYALVRTTFGKNLFNSFYVAVIVTISCMMISAFAGYAISRFKGKIFSFYSVLLLILQMFPGVLLLIPLFIIFKTLGVVDTPFSVILSYTTLNLPFSIWMLKGFFDTIPYEIEQSAMIDGCNQFESLYKIILPISSPGLSSVAIFTFINSWNEYLLASIFLRSDSIKTITLGLQKFVLQYTSDWAGLMAASTLATIPTIFFLLFAQKYLVKGLTAGSVKG